MMLRIHGRFAGGLSWQPAPGELLERSSTALGAEGRVWLIDPLRASGIEDQIAALGKVAGVVITFGLHDRDADWFAARYGVPVYGHPSLRLAGVRSPVVHVEGRVPDSLLLIVTCPGRGPLRWWRETAIWWPEMRTLVTGDAIGTAAYFPLPGREVAVHPVRWLSPPIELRPLPAERLHPGHGRSVTSGAAQQIARALDRARKELASAWWHAFKTAARYYTRRRR